MDMDDATPAYGMMTTTQLPFADAMERVRMALKEQGFGVLTEIDLQTTLRDRIGAELDPYVILGACNPPLAHRAVVAEPSIGLLLPCNVVVRQVGDGVRIEAMDPEAVMGVVQAPAVQAVASEARQRLRAALDSIPG